MELPAEINDLFFQVSGVVKENALAVAVLLVIAGLVFFLVINLMERRAWKKAAAELSLEYIGRLWYRKSTIQGSVEGFKVLVDYFVFTMKVYEDRQTKYKRTVYTRFRLDLAELLAEPVDISHHENPQLAVVGREMVFPNTYFKPFLSMLFPWVYLLRYQHILSSGRIVNNIRMMVDWAKVLDRTEKK